MSKCRLPRANAAGSPRLMLPIRHTPRRRQSVRRGGLGRKLLTALTAALTGAALAGALAYQHWKYPFGKSPNASRALFAALEAYARAHDGNFPAGGATPEASLTLLYEEGFLQDPLVLRGKCVPVNVAQDVLQRGADLDPATCGWHYEEGLRPDDDPRLALAWDKFGLGADGGRVFRGGCEVLYVDGATHVIRDYLWVEFTREQSTLRAEREASRREDQAPSP